MPPLSDLEKYGVANFTSEDIKNMSMAEYSKYRALLLEAAAGLPPKHKGDIVVGSPPMTCMWCAAGPFATTEELEEHEAEC